MTEKLKQKIKEEVTKLPKDTQGAINSVDWIKETEEIGKKFLISESGLNDFQVQILLILIGLSDPSLFSLNIEDNIGTSKAEAEKIAQEANQKIFTPIYSVLEENIKKNLPSRRITPEQNLNFILSGGDYMAFLEQREGRGEVGQSNPGRTEGEVKEVRKTATPAERNKTNSPTSPRKMTDIKSKFTI